MFLSSIWLNNFKIASSVNKSLDKALENINLEIKKGETLGIIGTIGSGKTTLMNLLTRLNYEPR